MAGLYDYYKDLPGWGKGIVAGVATYAGYLIYKKIKDEAEAKDEKKEIVDTNKELEALLKKYTPTYPDSQYKTWANQLEDYMFDVGTDKTGILAVLNRLKHDADFLMLKKAFGTRTYYTFGIDYGKKTLGQWLAIEDSWWEDLVKDSNAILYKKGIKYRF
jgi:hypothetical protein